MHNTKISLSRQSLNSLRANEFWIHTQLAFYVNLHRYPDGPMTARYRFTYADCVEYLSTGSEGADPSYLMRKIIKVFAFAIRVGHKKCSLHVQHCSTRTDKEHPGSLSGVKAFHLLERAEKLCCNPRITETPPRLPHCFCWRTRRP